MRRLALSAMLLVACGRGDTVRSDTVAAGGGQPSPAASSQPQTTDGGRRPPDTACAKDGLWKECALFDRLDRAGLAPRHDTAAATEPPLTPRGYQIQVGNATLELYVYPDSRTREKEQRLLDKAKYVSFDAPLTMQSQPTLIYSANLIAILHSRNDHLRERVADAITAGPPQPPTPTTP